VTAMYVSLGVLGLDVVLMIVMFATGVSFLEGGGGRSVMAGGILIVILSILMVIVFLAAGVLGLIGQIFNLSVPTERDPSLKGLAIATLACYGAWRVFLPAHLCRPVRRHGPGPAGRAGLLFLLPLPAARHCPEL